MNRVLADFPNLPRIDVSASNVAQLYRLSESFPEGCEVQFADGEVVIDRPVLLPSRTVLQGCREQPSTIRLAPGSNCHMFTNVDHVGGNSHIEVQDLKFDGSGTAQSRPADHRPLTFACGFYFRRCFGVKFTNVEFRDIAQTAVQLNNCMGVHIDGFLAEQMGWSGIGTSRASNVFMAGVVVRGAGVESTHSGIHLDGGCGIQLEADVRDVSGNGIMLDSAYCDLLNCEVRGRVERAYRGVSLSGKSDARLENVIIDVDAVENRAAGVMVSNAENVALVGGHIHNNGTFGVLLQGRRGGRGVSISSRVSIMNNSEGEVAEIHGSKRNWWFGDQSNDEPRLNLRSLADFSESADGNVDGWMQRFGAARRWPSA